MKRTSVRVPENHLARLTEIAKRDDRDVAFLIRRAIRDYLENDAESSENIAGDGRHTRDTQRHPEPVPSP